MKSKLISSFGLGVFALGTVFVPMNSDASVLDNGAADVVASVEVEALNQQHAQDLENFDLFAGKRMVTRVSELKRKTIIIE